MHTAESTPGRSPGDRTLRRAAFLLPVACLLLAGCRGLRGIGKPDDRYELLTAELRTRERELIEARAELEHLRLLAQTYQRQTPHMPACPTPAFGATGGVPTLPVREITLGSGTGGVDDDGQPGDESLTVVVVPRDDDGTAVKVPARVTVTAFEVTPQGLKFPIGRWEVPPDQVRRTWRTGILGSGYFVPLQWDKLPATGRVRVVAQVQTLDGQAFEADKDVTVRPLPGAGVRGPTVIPPPAVPDMPEQLPPPVGAPAARLVLPPP